MTNGRLNSDSSTNIDSPIGIASINFLDRMALTASVLLLESSAISAKSNEKQFRHALIHCAAVLFVLICCICAVFAYYIFEPFLHCILWALLLGTLLFPLKNHSTTWARSFLEQSRMKQHFLWYDAGVLLPCRTIDRTFEWISSFCRRHWKGCLFMTLFRPTLDSLDVQLLRQYLTKINFYPLTLCQIDWQIVNHTYWMPFLILYVVGVLTYSKRSRLIQTSLSFITGSVWLMLLVYVSQSLSVTYRLMILSLLVFLLILGFLSDRQERKESKHRGEFNQSFLSSV